MKKSYFATMMLGSAAMPYLFSGGGNSGDEANKAPTAAHAAADAKGQTPPAEGAHYSAMLNQADHAAPHVLAAGHPLNMPPLEGEIHRLDEILSFNVSPRWIIEHWQRVSNGLADPDRQGYRVPLVTGTGEGDLAGSLTYYYDAKQTLLRITFQGKTANPAQLVAYLTSQRKFSREIDPDPGLYAYRYREFSKVKGELKITAAEIIRADEPRRRYDVSLTLDRPSDWR